MAVKEISLYEAYTLMFRDYPDVVTVPDLQQMLGGVGRKEVYRLLRDKKIDCVKSGKGYKVTKLSVLKYMLSR